MEVTVYGKDGCHLCEAVEAEIRSMKAAGVSLTVIDIEDDPALESGFWLRVPVVVVAGREIFEAKMMDPEGRWKERLRSLLDGP